MYLLVTPVRNEEDKLKDFIKFVKEQSLPPLLWVIVNDGSTDKSMDIIQEETKGYNYIHFLNLEEKDDYGPRTYSKPVNYGFNFIIEYAKKHHILYKYLGILDADIFIEKRLDIILKTIREKLDGIQFEEIDTKAVKDIDEDEYLY